MFSLIITIISIALVAALALATLYYGGKAFSKGAADATAAKVLLQGQQLLGAAELYKAENGVWPASLAVLVSDNYLKSIPVAFAPVGEALATDKAWLMPVVSVPVFVLLDVAPEACTSVNKKAYGVDAILKTARTEYLAQCFGLASNTLKVVVGKTTADLVLAAANPGATVSLGVMSPLPAPADRSSPEWLDLTAPAGGSLTADTSMDFGSVALNSATTRSFTFRSTGNLPVTGVYANLSASLGLSLTGNTCGTLTLPVTVAAGATCQLTVRWQPTAASSLNGTRLSLAGADTGAPVSLPLAGLAGAFNATGAWATEFSALVAPTPATQSFGTLTTLSGPVTRTYSLRNTGTYGALNSGFTLTGDTSHFKITQVVLYAGWSNVYGCDAALASNGLSTTRNCEASDVNGGTVPTISVTVAYRPLSSGSHSVTLTPASANGSALPAPLVLTGAGAFNPTGAWSTEFSALVAPTPATQSFGTLTTLSGPVTRTYSLRNTGTYGALNSGFTLTGDTSHFKITQVVLFAGWNVYGCNADLAPNGLSTTRNCEAADVNGGAVPTISVTVAYRPLSSGSHSVTLTPASANGTVVPAPLVLTGSGS